MWCRNPLLSPNYVFRVILMKIEWLVTDATPVGSPDRAERDILGMILGVFGQFRPLLWSGSHFVIWESPLKP